MSTHNMLQVFSKQNDAQDAEGFRLTGVAKEGEGLCRVHLRRFEPWHRYHNPRVWSEAWDVRIYTKTDASFTLETELTVADLETLEEDYTFPDGAEGLARLEPIGDPVYDRTLAWARRVTGAGELDVKQDIFPVHLEVRYSKASAKETVIAPIPAGRPTPPFHKVAPIQKTVASPAVKKPAPTSASTSRVPVVPTKPAPSEPITASSRRQDSPTPRAVDSVPPRRGGTIALGALDPKDLASSDAPQEELSAPVVQKIEAKPAAPTPTPAKPALPPRQPVSSKLTQRLHSIREELEAERQNKEAGNKDKA